MRETRLSGMDSVPGGRVETGTSERSMCSVGISPRDRSSSRKPPLTRVSATSFTVPPSACRTVRTSSSDTVVEVAPGPTDRADQRGARRVRGEADRRQPLRGLRCPAYQPAGCAERGREDLGPCCRGSGRLPQAPRQHRGSGGWRRGLPAVLDGRSRLGCGVQDEAEDVRPGHPVDHAVVQLRDERPPSVGETLDEPVLPQRAAAVHPARHHPGHEAVQLLAAAGRGQSGVADVPAHVELRVVHPGRRTEVEGHRVQLLPVPGEQGQPALDGFHELVERGSRALEHGESADGEGGAGDPRPRRRGRLSPAGSDVPCLDDGAGRPRQARAEGHRLRGRAAAVAL